MTESIDVLDFSSGASVGEEFKKKEDAARQAARGSQKYFSLKNDGETAILRFLFEANQMGVNRNDPISSSNPHDPLTGWILAKDHGFVKTKAAPRDKPAESNWPDNVSAVCRRTPIGNDQHPAYANCYICDNIKNDRGRPEIPTVDMWASAVLREEVIGSQELVDAGRIDASQIGQRIILDQGDWIDEVDTSGTTTGKKVWRKRYVIVNMAMTNFFSPLVSLADYWTTILDRDYKITRKGEPKARRVEYVPVALAPYQVTVLRDGQPVVINYDLREPEIAALYADSKLARTDLMKVISRKVSKPFYDRFFDISVEVSWKDMQPDDEDSKKGGTPAAAAAAPDAPPPPPTPQQQAGQTLTKEPTEGVTAEALAAMRSKVMGDQGAPASTPAPAVPAAQETAPPPPPAAAPPAPAPAATAASAAPPLVGVPAPQQS